MIPDPSSVDSVLAWYRAKPWLRERDPSAPWALLGHAWDGTGDIEHKNMLNAALLLVQTGDAEARSDMLRFLQTHGDEVYDVLRGWLRDPPAWLDDADPNETDARLARGVLRWAFWLAERDPSVRPLLDDVYRRDPIPSEWLGFWLNADPAGTGLSLVTAALDRGDSLERSAWHIGITYGSLATACLPALFAAFRGRGTRTVRAAVLSEIVKRQAANPDIVKQARAALG